MTRLPISLHWRFIVSRNYIYNQMTSPPHNTLPDIVKDHQVGSFRLQVFDRTPSSTSQTATRQTVVSRQVVKHEHTVPTTIWNTLEDARKFHNGFDSFNLRTLGPFLPSTTTQTLVDLPQDQDTPIPHDVLDNTVGISLTVHQEVQKYIKQCGFYYGALSMPEARSLLKRASVGSFILRDSSQSDFILSLSVRTKRGTTSLRIKYQNNRFQFDCLKSTSSILPSFSSIPELIEYYTECSRTNTKMCVFLETSGRCDTPVLLNRPFLKEVHSLMHMARVKINERLTEANRKRLLLFMQPGVEKYLQAYPHKV